jgi:hypothetical protein
VRRGAHEAADQHDEIKKKGVLVVGGASFSLVLHAVNVLIPMSAAPPTRSAI